MKNISRRDIIRMLPWAIPFLTIAIFVFDAIMPVGVAVSVLYLLPLMLTFLSPRSRDPLYFAVLATGLLWLNLLLKPPGLPVPYAMFNRVLGTLVLWGMVVGMVRYRAMVLGFHTAEAEREQAVASREAAIEARTLSDVATAGAVRRELDTARELYASKLRLDGVIQSTMDAVLIVDERQRVLLFNEAAARMFVCPVGEAIGQPLDRFIPARFRDAHRHHVDGFSRSGVTSRRMGQLGTVVGLRSDGEEFPVEAAISHYSAEGRTFYTVILRDITDRRRLEEQLRRTERIAELGTVASGMAHEIGTPMNVILGRAEVLMDSVTDESARKGLQVIVDEVGRITRVMDQLLSFARRRAPDRQRLRLQDVIDSSLEMFSARVAQSHVQVVRQVDAACPAVHADRDQMNQILINLVMNAIHAMPNGGTLTIGLRPENNMVKLTVGDTGCGIPQALIEKIFQPFFTTKEVGKGTGLGLTVVKDIIDEHQGSITVESEEGKGTVFAILLPVSR